MFFQSPCPRSHFCGGRPLLTSLPHLNGNSLLVRTFPKLLVPAFTEIIVRAFPELLVRTFSKLLGRTFLELLCRTFLEILGRSFLDFPSSSFLPSLSSSFEPYCHYVSPQLHLLCHHLTTSAVQASKQGAPIPPRK